MQIDKVTTHIHFGFRIAGSFCDLKSNARIRARVRVEAIARPNKAQKQRRFGSAEGFERRPKEALRLRASAFHVCDRSFWGVVCGERSKNKTKT